VMTANRAGPRPAAGGSASARQRSDRRRRKSKRASQQCHSGQCLSHVGTEGGHLICLDTGCTYGGKLTAMKMGSGEVWQANGSIMIGSDKSREMD